jgi:hypothetical protein
MMTSQQNGSIEMLDFMKKLVEIIFLIVKIIFLIYVLTN